MPKLYQKRGTRAQLDAAKAVNQLNAGEIYVVTDENRLAVGLSANTYQDFDKEPIVTTWTNKPTGNTLTPYVDKVFITDVGVGGSEWYWDGTRYRAVGGQVVLSTNISTAAINVSVPASGQNKILSKAQVIPAGLLSAGDVIVVETAITKTGTAATANIDLSLSATATDNYVFVSRATVVTSSANGFSNSIMRSVLLSNTSIRSLSVAGTGYGQATSTPSASTISNVTSNELSVGWYIPSGTTSSDVINLLSVRVTIQTCGG